MKTLQIAESSLIKTVVPTGGLKFESRNEVDYNPAYFAGASLWDRAASHEGTKWRSGIVLTGVSLWVVIIQLSCTQAQ